MQRLRCSLRACSVLCEQSTHGLVHTPVAHVRAFAHAVTEHHSAEIIEVAEDFAPHAGREPVAVQAELRDADHHLQRRYLAEEAILNFALAIEIIRKHLPDDGGVRQRDERRKRPEGVLGGRPQHPSLG